MGEITELIGAEAALRMAIDFGGVRVYVPKKPREDCALVASIGKEKAERLARRFGGVELGIAFGESRRVTIIALRARKLTVATIARNVGCTARYVWQVLAKERHSATAARSDEPPVRGK